MTLQSQDLEPRLSAFHSPSVLARRLGFFGSALFVVFAVLVVATILPPRLLDPNWQLRFVSSLLNQASIPLVGLGLLFLASYVDPGNGALERLARRCARLSIVAALGFFLLIPVQLAGVWGKVGLAIASQNRDITTTAAQAETFRRLINSASSPQALQQALIAQRVQPLTPAQLSRPMPVLRAQLLERLASAEKRLEGQPRGLQLRHWLSLVQGMTGSMLVSLAYGLAFAAGGQARGKEVSLLDQWLQRWQDRGERLREVVEQRVDQRRFTSEEQPEAPSYIETVTLALGPGGRSVPAVQAIQEAASSQELETIRRMLHLSPLSAADRLKPLEQLKREMVLALTDV
jgi:hypothetical protein